MAKKGREKACCVKRYKQATESKKEKVKERNEMERPRTWCTNRVELMLFGQLSTRDMSILVVSVLLENSEKRRQDEGNCKHCDTLGEDCDIIANCKFSKAADRRSGGEEDACSDGKNCKNLRDRVALVEEQHAENQACHKRATAEYHMEGHGNVVVQSLVVQDANSEEDCHVCGIETKTDLTMTIRKALLSSSTRELYLTQEPHKSDERKLRQSHHISSSRILSVLKAHTKKKTHKDKELHHATNTHKKK